MIRQSLSIFLEREILPVYDTFDIAHDLRHVKSVMQKAVSLAKQYEADAEMCLCAAAYHDTGLREGRKTHHTASARFLKQDERLTQWFTEEQIGIMADACEDHRASSEKPPRTLYGKILADADREYTIGRIVERTLEYGYANFPEMTLEEQFDRAMEHVREKYGENGYLTFFLDDPKEERAKILQALSSRAKFHAVCREHMGGKTLPLSVKKYLNRIGFVGEAAPTVETLQTLQMRHLRSVPYENMDILRGIPLSQDYHALYDKIVTRHRGGYCFELNELFGFLLRAVGYHVTDCFARFLAGEQAIPMRRHHVLIVNVPGEAGRWLCDVGVGSGSPTWPVLLQEDMMQQQQDATWKVTKDDFLGWVLWQYAHGEWRQVFSFTEEKQLAVDYAAASFWCENAKESPFTKQPMISLRTETGRITLDGNELRHFDGDEVRVETVDSVEETLEKVFGINEE